MRAEWGRDSVLSTHYSALFMNDQRFPTSPDTPAAPPPAVRPSQPPLKKPVQFMKGVGPRRAEQLARLGISTVEDLLYHIPFRYQDRRGVKKIRDLTLGGGGGTGGQLARHGPPFLGRRRRGGAGRRIRDQNRPLFLRVH